MANILKQIIEHKKIELAEHKLALPLAQFLSEVKPTKRCFLRALTQKGPRFILECKKASPSKGLIRTPFDLTEITSAYAKYADCISVLTDEHFFQGSYDYLTKVRALVEQPLLHKDFIIDSYQIYRGRYHGADAVLLMLSVLDDVSYQHLSNLASSLNMTVLTEVSNEEETLRAVALGAKLIGINNRNLRDLSTHLDTSFRLAKLIPSHITVVSESGIYTHQQVRELSQVADAFLVGSSLMAQVNLDSACRALVFGEQKICGLTQKEDAYAAYSAGAYYGGLIFYAKSPRALTKEQALDIQSGAPELHYVGVFVDEDKETVLQCAKELKLAAVQLHGNESDAYLSDLREKLPAHCQIWKAYRVQQELPTLTKLADRYVLDTYHQEAYGGTGQRFNWQVLEGLTQDERKHTHLAGGLQASLVQAALQQPVFALDFNSGLENAPGQKDPQKIQHAFKMIREFSYE